MAQQVSSTTGRFGALLASAGHSASPSNVHGDALIRDAVVRLNAHASIAAKVRQEVNLFGHVLLGSGEYFQQGSGADRRLRLALRIQLGEKSSSMLQICDGSNLWLLREMEKQPELERIDLMRVAQVQAVARPQLPVIGSPQSLGHGGLPALLDSLATNFRFEKVQRGELHKQPVYILRGEWNVLRLAQLFPDMKADIAGESTPDLKKLPAQMPRSIIVLLGTDDLFPYRIEFHRHEGNAAADASDAADPKPMVTMQWFEVEINGQVNPQEFVFQPGTRKFTDGTDAYLRSLGL